MAMETALKLRDLLNAGETQEDAVHAVGLDPDDEENPVYGEDIGDECLPIGDPDNDVIDLGWTDDVHYQVRRFSGRSFDRPWFVEEMRRHESSTTKEGTNP